MIDLWRDYTHYSHPHDVYTRIDYIFIYKRDRHRVEQCEQGNIDLSDHTPVMVTIQINSQVGNTLWRLNSSILNYMPFKTQIKKEIEQFLKENNNGEVASEIVWDTLKAVLRGEIISYCAKKKKERQLRLAKLNEELGELETKHKKDLNANVAAKIKGNQAGDKYLIFSRDTKKYDLYKTKIL